MAFGEVFKDRATASLLNRFSLCNVQVGLFPTRNTQATSSSKMQSRSESCIAVNPKNPANMIGASKKFDDPAIYLFQVGPIYTFDGGVTWHESSLPREAGWDGMTDPTVAFDHFGNAFIVAEPLKFNTVSVGTPEDLTGLGMVVFRSTNGGANWGTGTRLTLDTSDDKQWVVCDNHPSSPHYGNVYVAWAADSPLRFARSTDHGQTWMGKGQQEPGSTLVSFAFAPDLSVSPDGTLHVFWHQDRGSTISYLRSADGGVTFSPVTKVATGVASLHGHLPETNLFAHFDHGRFRVYTLVTSCAGDDGVVVAAWADMREGRSRIYYRRSLDGGLTWEGSDSGQPLLPNVRYSDLHCFHPQIACTGTGVIGCSFYVFGEEFGHNLIRVQLAGSWDDAASFPTFVTVTDRSWDPLVNAPAVHGDPKVDFIGEYFGLDAGEEHFALLWTDTRTGVQELFCDIVQTKRVTCPRLPDLVGEVLLGVVQDGGGLVIVGGKVVKVPPRSPLIPLLEAVARADIRSGAADVDIDAPELRRTALRAVLEALEQERP